MTVSGNDGKLKRETLKVQPLQSDSEKQDSFYQHNDVKDFKIPLKVTSWWRA